MKVALLTDGIYPYVLGGMQKHSYYLAKYFARNEVYVDLYHTGLKEANTEELKGFTKQELSFIKPFYLPFPSTKNLPGHYILESYIYSCSIYKLLLANKPTDFIYAQGFTGWKTIQEKRNGKNLPITGVNFHGVEMFQQAPSFNVKMQHLLFKRPVKYILNNADIVFSLGGKLTEIQKELTSQKVIEIPIGIEECWLSETPKKKNEERIFIFIGRYERRKGIEELNKVLTQLCDSFNFRFYFIGPIPENKKLRIKNINYLGLIKEEHKVKELLAAADVLVCPSYSEGMPTVILEAMACGLAVIATDVGAVNELVSSETGWLIPHGNEEALREALVEAINIKDKALGVKKVAAQKLICNNFTWSKVITMILTELKAQIPFD